MDIKTLLLTTQGVYAMVFAGVIIIGLLLWWFISSRTRFHPRPKNFTPTFRKTFIETEVQD